MVEIKMLRDFKVAPEGHTVELWESGSVHEVSDALAFDLEEGLVAVLVTGDDKIDAKTEEAAMKDLDAALKEKAKAEAEEKAALEAELAKKTS